MATPVEDLRDFPLISEDMEISEIDYSEITELKVRTAMPWLSLDNSS